MATALEVLPAQLVPTTTNPRKRKKRAPAAGAAADCFKCQERKASCDRRRPYCSQCLDAGQDCSGYKTQLTWGVGVASRGKLRGLSLPVPGTQQVVAASSPQRTKKRRESNDDTPQSALVSTVVAATTDEQWSRMPLVAIKTEDQGLPPTLASTQDTVWDPSFFSTPHIAQRRILNNEPTHPAGQSFYTSPSTASGTYMSCPDQPDTTCRDGTWPDEQLPTTTYVGEEVPMTATTESASFLDQLGSFFHESVLSTSGSNFPQASAPSVHSDAEQHYDGLSMLLQAGQSMERPSLHTINEMDEEVKGEQYDECAISDDVSLLQASVPFNLNFMAPSPSSFIYIGKTARMQYLINYYAEVISPVIVAFDSPSNPFRTQVLRLAAGSETLQHAISALAASNLRQRRGIGLLSTGKTAPARRSSFAHVHLANEYAQTMLSTEDQMREEVMHKRLAVSQLNQQLAHPVLRKDDSILATLLVLCLFHVCDSGIAKFQTQFAGVQKLLALRGDNARAGNEDSKWMTRLFTWFDSLTATVNDREGQIDRCFLNTTALYGDWTLENMAGIDGQLFKSVSKLGRLNLLRQGKSVDPNAASVTNILPSVPIIAEVHAPLDGNGWIRQDSVIGLGISDGSPDADKLFWQEWNTVRHELLSWNLDTSLFDSYSRESSNLTAEQRIDMENISQSFRYSALVYLERLAQPLLSSSDETIQRWVTQSLNYIKKVVSDVYLLWPLFITGTECIGEAGRNVIRARCTDIQKDSGFVNNASCLQLLEKVWKATSSGSSPAFDGSGATSTNHSLNHSSNSAFVFRDVMIDEAKRTEGYGEYIVV